MPRYADVIDISVQKGQPYMWALVDTDEPIVFRKFKLRGTGHDCEGFRDYNHVKSFMLNDDAFVGHVFEVVADLNAS